MDTYVCMLKWWKLERLKSIEILKRERGMAKKKDGKEEHNARLKRKHFSLQAKRHRICCMAGTVTKERGREREREWVNERKRRLERVRERKVEWLARGGVRVAMPKRGSFIEPLVWKEPRACGFALPKGGGYDLVVVVVFHLLTPFCPSPAESCRKCGALRRRISVLDLLHRLVDELYSVSAEASSFANFSRRKNCPAYNWLKFEIFYRFFFSEFLLGFSLVSLFRSFFVSIDCARLMNSFVVCVEKMQVILNLYLFTSSVDRATPCHDLARRV